jgi:hypothetical protein
MTPLDPRVESFRHPRRIYSRSEVLTRPSPVPERPGVYGWYFRGIPDAIEASGCSEVNGLRLMYVGIAPRRATGSRATLRSRLVSHYRGNAEGSTLRLTLGCLLGLQLRRVGGGTVMTFGPAEVDLSEWMADNAFVAWIEDPKPWLVESNLIANFDLPLNLDQNAAHPAHASLSQLRQDARRRALMLPISAAI